MVRLVIKMEGIALKNGAIGDRITVHNSSKQDFRGFCLSEKKFNFS